jgi:hypothetical protein
MSRARFLSQSRFTFSTSAQTLYGGGVGSGKSRSLIERAVFLAAFIPGNVGMLGAYTFPQLRDTTQLQFFQELEDAGLSDLVIDVKKNDQTVVMRTHDANSKKPRPSTILFRHVFEPRPDKKHLASLNLGFFGGDQIEDWEEGIWDYLQTRLRHKVVDKAYAFGVYNPKGHGWWWNRFKAPCIKVGLVKPAGLLGLDNPEAIHPNFQGYRVDEVPGLNGKPVKVEAFRAGPDMICYCTKTEENTTLRPNYVENMRATMPSELVARLLDGSDDMLEGKVYKEFTGHGSVHCLKSFPIPKHWKTIVSVDPGGDVPWAINTYRYDDGNSDFDVIVSNELYSATVLMEDIARWIKNPERSGIPDWRDPQVRYVIDPENAVAIREFREKHDLLFERAHKADKNSGIFLVAGYFHRIKGRTACWPDQDYLHALSVDRGDLEIHDAPHLWVFADRCPMWVKQHDEWYWAKDLRTNASKEKPVDKDDHACDECLYAMRILPQVSVLRERLDPELERLRGTDYMRFISAVETRLAMSLGSGEPENLDRPTGEAFLSEAGGIEEQFEKWDNDKIEW